ncbi:MAG: hypothetical protein IJX38_03905 [Clostridia bacterium]|nr:hypothetical protein [Clostridia bacterium]
MKNTTKELFAARNGHRGFESIFQTVFDPKKYARIYILKGGPGTGKSSLMRRISEHFSSCDCTVKNVLCSSDPSSLDGVIIETPSASVAIIDGTAPHCTDPTIPGAVEEIINLGVAFDTDALSKKRAVLTELNERKRISYEKGYRLLGCAGSIFEYIWREINVSSCYNKAEKQSEIIIKDLRPAARAEKIDTDFIAAFCKEGYKKLPIEDDRLTVINLCADRFVCGIIMKVIADRLLEKGVVTRICPSPLDSRLIDRIYTSDYVIAVNECSNSGQFYLGNIDTGIEDYDSLCRIYEELLELARHAFLEASDAHFGMEAIYKDAVDFKQNEKTAEWLIGKIADLIKA